MDTTPRSIDFHLVEECDLSGGQWNLAKLTGREMRAFSSFSRWGKISKICGIFLCAVSREM